MRKILTIVLSCAFLAACGNDQRDKADEHVREIVNSYDWSKGVPLYPMVRAYHECENYPEIYWCPKLHNQLMDISVSYETCKLQSPQSKLCGIVVNKIKDNPIRNILPTAEAVSLLGNPFYFLLPTKLLDENASGNGYRFEMWNAWIQKYQEAFDRIFLGAIISLIMWALFMFYKKEKTHQLEIEHRQVVREQEIVAEKFRNEESKKREAEIAAQQKADAGRIAEQKRLREIERAEIEFQLAAEKLAAEEAAAREAAEKKLIEDMMTAAVKNLPKKK